jgi:hypothetical protein
MANITSPPDPSTTFMRLPHEPAKAWTAFRMYRDMGPLDRAMDTVRVNLGKPPSYLRVIHQWSSKYQWVLRARAYDHYNEELSRLHAEQAIPLWEKRRQDSLEANMALASRLRENLMAMLDHPLTEEVRDDSRGVTVIQPAKWSYTSVASLAKTIAELEAATIAEALPRGGDESFDVETATIEQLRDFVARNTGKRKAQA